MKKEPKAEKILRLQGSNVECICLKGLRNGDLKEKLCLGTAFDAILQQLSFIIRHKIEIYLLTSNVNKSSTYNDSNSVESRRESHKSDRNSKFKVP